MLESPPMYETFNPTPTAEIEAFFQAWLFFGLIREVLDPCYHEEEFKDVAGAFVSTIHLLERLEQAWNSRVVYAQKDKNKQFEHIAKCLMIAWRALQITLALTVVRSRKT